MHSVRGTLEKAVHKQNSISEKIPFLQYAYAVLIIAKRKEREMTHEASRGHLCAANDALLQEDPTEASCAALLPRI